MRLLVAVAAVVAALTLAASSASAHPPAPKSVRVPVCQVFGRYCAQALAVVWCESRFRPWARNGQYLGLFQMGSWERARFGHGRTPLAQARAAHRYFVLTGRDWSPWSCRWAAL